MKTLQDLINLRKDCNVKSDEEIFIERVTMYVDSFTEEFYKDVKEINCTSRFYVLRDFNSVYGKKLAKSISKELSNLGFYSTYGVTDTTPSGNERAYVAISINEPKRNFFQRLFGL